MNSPVITNPDAAYARATAGDAQASYELGRYYAAQQSFSRARRWFRDAAERGHGDALTEIGLMELFGIGVPGDVAEGVRTLEAAERLGSGEAAYQLALMGFADSCVPYDIARMARRLQDAAQRGYVRALRAVALIYARTAGAAGASHACLERAAAQGDPTSAYLLALRLARSADAAQRERAETLFALAQRAGVARAATQRPGADAEPYVVPEPLAGDLPPFDLATALPQQRTRHSDAPFIETIDGVFNAEECEFVIALGEPYLEPSVVHDPRTGGLTRSDYRTSSTMAFYSFQEDFALRWLQWRQLELIGGVTMAQAEHLTLLRYRVSEEYYPHRDYLPPSVANDPAGAGQRVNTAFCYLSDVEEGGETEFPGQGIRIRPRRGRVVFFKNLLPDGTPDDSTLHAGLPVKRGEKWLATLWTRQRRYRPY
jgi:hypothetical protein